MAKKSNKIKLQSDGFIYSTNPDFSYETESSSEALSPEQQLLEVHFERKGRGGKTAVVVKNFVGPEDDLKELGRLLKVKCGVGGSVKDGEIIIQGEVRDKVLATLKDLGYKTKRIGG
jgi:translation initiation factor 1